MVVVPVLARMGAKPATSLPISCSVKHASATTSPLAYRGSHSFFWSSVPPAGDDGNRIRHSQAEPPCSHRRPNTVLLVEDDVMQEIAAAAAVFRGHAGLEDAGVPAFRTGRAGKLPSRSHCLMFGSISPLEK